MIEANWKSVWLVPFGGEFEISEVRVREIDKIDERRRWISHNHIRPTPHSFHAAVSYPPIKLWGWNAMS